MQRLTCRIIAIMGCAVSFGAAAGPLVQALPPSEIKPGASVAIVGSAAVPVAVTSAPPVQPAAATSPTPVPMPPTGAAQLDCSPRDAVLKTLPAAIGSPVELIATIPMDCIKDTSRLSVFLSGQRLNDVVPTVVGISGDKIHFTFTPITAANSANQWGDWLRERTGVQVSLGYDGRVLATAQPLLVFSPDLGGVVIRAVAVLTLVVLIVGAMAWRLRWSKCAEILREFVPPDSGAVDGDKRPYSLSRFQLFYWTMIIFFSYLGIYILTGAYDGVFHPNTLLLMGISLGTTGVAAATDSAHRQRAADAAGQVQNVKDQIVTVDHVQTVLTNDPNAAVGGYQGKSPVELEAMKMMEFQKLEQLKSKLSQTKSRLKRHGSGKFLQEILSDQNGPNLHRFQMFIWTLAFGAVFAGHVVTHLTFPIFDNSILAMMGLSSVTYLGLRLTEQHQTPDTADKNT